MYKKHGILGLFLLLVVILIVNPRVFYNLYNNILGRVLLIGVILFFTTFNVTLGLFAALCLIIASNMFFTEGLTTLNGSDSTMIQPGMTIGDDNVTQSSLPDDAKIKVTTKAAEKDKGTKISVLMDKAETQGVDRQTIQETMQSKSSKSIPINNQMFKSEDVMPNETTSTVLEGLQNKYAMF
jgi:K+-sensing histidine kinase KdpD